MYWDGEPNPSVECPIGDFFGTGFGDYQTWQSAVLGVTSGGFYSYFPMPFAKRGRITLTNETGYPLTVFFHLLGQRYEQLPNESLYFHAQWHRENPTIEGHNYAFADIAGDGYFAGVTQHMQAYTKGDKFNFLEGDEFYYIDNETTASIRGTGTEDYYQGGWYFKDGPFNAPYHGLMLKNQELMRVSCYRFHLLDRINFKTALRAQIEHGQRTYNEARVDYSSVAYWYQHEPHVPFPAIPADRNPITPKEAYLLPGAVEFEGIAGSMPYYASTYLTGWSNDMGALFVFNAAGQSTVPVNFSVPKPGKYAIGANCVGNDHNGVLQMLVDGQAIGPEIDTYTPDPQDDYLLCRNKVLGPQHLADINLTSGTHTVAVKVTRQNPKAMGYNALVDCITVNPSE